MAVAMGSAVRWQILRELAKGQALPVAELKRRMKGEIITYHMKALVKSGWVERKYGTLYGLTDTVRVDTAAGVLDLGPLILKLDVPGK